MPDANEPAIVKERTVDGATVRLIQDARGNFYVDVKQGNFLYRNGAPSTPDLSRTERVFEDHVRSLEQQRGVPRKAAPGVEAARFRVSVELVFDPAAAPDAVEAGHRIREAVMLKLRPWGVDIQRMTIARIAPGDPT